MEQGPPTAMILDMGVNIEFFPATYGRVVCNKGTDIYADVIQGTHYDARIIEGYGGYRGVCLHTHGYPTNPP